MPLPESCELPGSPHWRRLPSSSHLQVCSDSSKSLDLSQSVLERILEEDFESEDRPQTALVAESLQEHREHEQIRIPIAPPEQEGLARGLGALAILGGKAALR